MPSLILVNIVVLRQWNQRLSYPRLWNVCRGRVSSRRSMKEDEGRMGRTKLVVSCLLLVDKTAFTAIIGGNYALENALSPTRNPKDQDKTSSTLRLTLLPGNDARGRKTVDESSTAYWDFDSLE